jgi:TonB-dependent receptor
LRDEYETHRNLITQLGGEHQLGKIKLEWLASYVRATYDKPYDINTTFSGPGDGANPAAGFNATYDNITNPNFPVLKVAGVNLANPANFILKKVSNSAEYDKDQEYSYQAKLSVPVGLFADDNFAVGAKLRYREKSALKASSASVAGSGQPLTSFLGNGPYTNYYDGVYNIGYSANGDAISNTFGSQLAVHPLGQADTSFDDHEDIIAGFAQYQATAGKLHGLIGVRVEHTKASYGGFVNGAYQTIANSYTNAFPTAQLRYEVSPKLIARGTWSTGIARPGFLQTIQSGSVDLGGQVVTTGNPYLKPTTSNNFDLSLEYYLPNAGVISVGLFDKEMRNYIIASTFRAPYPLSGSTSPFLWQSFANVSGAYARGIEASYVNKFTTLPAPFNGLGIDANVAYVDSSVALHAGLPSQPLPGTFEYTGNAALFYEKGPVNLRLAMQYESKALFGVGGSPTAFTYATISTDVYEDKRVTLDLSGSYDFTHNVKFYASVKNLTDAPLRFYEGTSNRPIQREFYGQTYEAGVKVKL